MSGNKIALTAGLLASTIGPMTPMERAAGRYMRAPDHDAADGGFAEFAAAGEVEVGEKAEIETSGAAPAGAGKEATAKEPEPKTGEPGKTPEPAPAKEGEEAGAGEADEEEEEEEPAKPKKKASERIRELTTRNRSQGRLIEQLSQRLEKIEKGGLPAGESGGNTGASGKTPAPDPSDAAKYPLGHLDDRYIEDKLEWLAEQKAGAQADAVLHRQQERERAAAAEKATADLLTKVDDLSTRGSELFEDFQEAVVDSGLRGDWRLEQPTFEAAHEADHGAQILYELSQDKKEAARVASLSAYQQMRFVMDRNTEISKTAKPRTKPGAGAPPATQTRGANSRTRPNASTDNLDDFEKAWAADAKG